MNYSSYEKALQAIFYGHRYAMRLKLRLEEPIMADDGSVYDLAKSIVDCFSSAIANLPDKPKSGDEQLSHVSLRDSSPSHLQISNSKKRKIINTSSSKKWRDDSPNPIRYDGFYWRKYGEKDIKSYDHKRNYYRCSYNINHQCGARKHEQMIKDNPPVYRTTYVGHHTCQINHNQETMCTSFKGQVDDDLESARIIRFGKDLEHEKENHSGNLCFSDKHKEDFKDKDTDVVDKNGQDLIGENLTSLSRFYPLLSSSGSESSEYNSEFVWDNLGCCDPVQFNFDLP